MTNAHARALAGPHHPFMVHTGDQYVAAMTEMSAELDDRSRADYRRAIALVAEIRDDLVNGRYNLEEWHGRAHLWEPPTIQHIVTDLALAYALGQYSAESAFDSLYDLGYQCLADVIQTVHHDNRCHYPGADIVNKMIARMCRPCVLMAVGILAYTLSMMGVGNDRLYRLAGLPQDHVWP